jgi:hypothetical protein
VSKYKCTFYTLKKKDQLFLCHAIVVLSECILDIQEQIPLLRGQPFVCSTLLDARDPIWAFYGLQGQDDTRQNSAAKILIGLPHMDLS